MGTLPRTGRHRFLLNLECLNKFHRYHIPACEHDGVTPLMRVGDTCEGARERFLGRPLGGIPTGGERSPSVAIRAPTQEPGLHVNVLAAPWKATGTTPSEHEPNRRRPGARPQYWAPRHSWQTAGKHLTNRWRTAGVVRLRPLQASGKTALLQLGVRAVLPLVLSRGFRCCDLV